MEWNRGTAPTQPAPQPAVNHTVPSGHKKKFSILSLPTASVALVFCIAILILAIAGYVALGNPDSTAQNKLVDKTKLQAVFLNDGQVYFGKIADLNDKFIRVQNIYYLRVTQQVQPNGTQTQGSPELVKLGCELHRPSDEMLINRDQVNYWENLKDDSAENTIPGAVKKYLASNPGTQKCATAAATDTSTTPATTTPTTTTPTTPTTKKP